MVLQGNAGDNTGDILSDEPLKNRAIDRMNSKPRRSQRESSAYGFYQDYDYASNTSTHEIHVREIAFWTSNSIDKLKTMLNVLFFCYYNIILRRSFFAT